MRIATWNIDRCHPNSVRAVRLLEHIRGVEADVWVLTETYRDFSPGAGYNFTAHSGDAVDRDSAEGECWVAIWSRLQAAPVNLSADPGRVAAIKLAGCDVVVVGTVLPWLTDSSHPHLRGTAAYRDRLVDQSREWRRLGKEAGGRLCVAGDFNQDLLPTGHYYQSADSRQALRDVLGDCKLMCLTGERSDPLASAPPLATIDHICIGAGLRGVSQPPSKAWPEPGTLTGNLSDHYGVWADVEVI